jgi:predicted nucleotidyltransferase
VTPNIKVSADIAIVWWHNLRRNSDMPNLIEQHIGQVTALCRTTGARQLKAFGSVLRKDFSDATSDLDFLVEFDALEPSKYADSYFALKEGLEALFGRPVDLVTTSSIGNPYFRERIAATSQTVYAR